jgi:hypothetical protein
VGALLRNRLYDPDGSDPAFSSAPSLGARRVAKVEGS